MKIKNVTCEPKPLERRSFNEGGWRRLIYIFCLIFSFHNLTAREPVITRSPEKVAPARLGSEWGPGLFPGTVEAWRLLPIISYMQAVVLQKIAQKFVMRADFKDHFFKREESPLKMMLRRQYYLYTKGVPIDNVSITFSLEELLNAGILDQRIEQATKTGKLDLSNLKISSLYGLEEVADKVGVVILELDLRHNEIEKIWTKHFDLYFSRLQRLDLSYNQINFLETGCFDQLINLRFLDLGNNKIFYLPKFIFSMLKNLEGLDLSDNQLKSFEKPKLEKLKRINLVNNFA